MMTMMRMTTTSGPPMTTIESGCVYDLGCDFGFGFGFGCGFDCFLNQTSPSQMSRRSHQSDDASRSACAWTCCFC